MYFFILTIRLKAIPASCLINYYIMQGICNAYPKLTGLKSFEVFDVLPPFADFYLVLQ